MATLGGIWNGTGWQVEGNAVAALPMSFNFKGKVWSGSSWVPLNQSNTNGGEDNDQTVVNKKVEEKTPSVVIDLTDIDLSNTQDSDIVTVIDVIDNTPLMLLVYSEGWSVAYDWDKKTTGGFSNSGIFRGVTRSGYNFRNSNYVPAPTCVHDGNWYTVLEGEYTNLRGENHHHLLLFQVNLTTWAAHCYVVADQSEAEGDNFKGLLNSYPASLVVLNSTTLRCCAARQEDFFFCDIDLSGEIIDTDEHGVDHTARYWPEYPDGILINTGGVGDDGQGGDPESWVYSNPVSVSEAINKNGEFWTYVLFVEGTSCKVVKGRHSGYGLGVTWDQGIVHEWAFYPPVELPICSGPYNYFRPPIQNDQYWVVYDKSPNGQCWEYRIPLDGTPFTCARHGTWTDPNCTRFTPQTQATDPNLPSGSYQTTLICYDFVWTIYTGGDRFYAMYSHNKDHGSFVDPDFGMLSKVFPIGSSNFVYDTVTNWSSTNGIWTISQVFVKRYEIKPLD